MLCNRLVCFTSLESISPKYCLENKPPAPNFLTAEYLGFFYITNVGLSQEQVNRQFAIGKEFFELPHEEKLKYRADLEAGSYNGYRPLGSIEIFPGLRDNVEFYNVFKFIPQYERKHPDVIKQNYAEIERFHRHIHESVVYKLLRLIAIILELPDEDFLVNAHLYQDNSECFLRYMRYLARSTEENENFQNLYLRGHTDFGSLTFVFSQPVAALQVKTPEGTWKYVKPHPGSIVVNTADLLQFWTNGFLKSSVHRVVVPPEDQAHVDRLGLLYFVRPTDTSQLTTVDSPLLRRMGLKKNDGGGGDDEVSLTAGEWIRSRIKKNWTRSPADKDGSINVGGLKARLFHQ
jgi:isopenicillin N synthase-like dioxygenase